MGRIFVMIISSLIVATNLFAQDKYSLTRLNIDHEESNSYAPFIFGDSLLYCSDKKKGLVLEYRDSLLNNPTTGIYVTYKINGAYQPGKIYDKGLNTNYHEGPMDVDPISNELYFTRNIKENNKSAKSFLKKQKDYNKLGIFIHKPNTAEVVHAFEFNNKKYDVGHPCFSKDGKYLVFASNKKGGFGNSDLFMCERKESGWSNPILLDSIVNSSFNELFPRFSPRNQLYFASNRDTSAKLDIFVCEGSFPNILSVKKMPAPINTEYDDFSIDFFEEPIKGVLSSNREGRDNLYTFNVDYPDFNDCDSVELPDLCYTLYEEATMDMDSLPLIYEWEFGDGNKKPGIEVDYCYAKPGTYTIKLNVVDTIAEAVYMNDATFELTIDSIRKPFIMSKDTVAVGEKVWFSNRGTIVDDFKPNNFYWQIEGNKFKGDSIWYKFDTIGQYNITMGVTSTLDSVGEYQSKCVYKYVHVVASNILTTSNNESGLLKFHKRFEAPVFRQFSDEETIVSKFYAVELIKSKTKLNIDSSYFQLAKEKYGLLERNHKDVFSYQVGNAKSPLELYTVHNDLHSLGYKNATVVENIDESIVELDNLDKLKAEQLIGKTIRLYSFLFKPNESTPYSSNENELSTIYNLLKKNENVWVYIIAYTDSDGNEKYNQKLSEKRAKTIYDLLLKRGVDKKQMKFQGKGELNPVLPNVSDVNKAKNRRVEIEIHKLDE